MSESSPGAAPIRRMSDASTEVLILGAGLLGTGVALELARRGFDVALVERDAHPLGRASLRNEGKIHLGFIYANDRSRATAFLQLEGALHFRAIVERWVGPAEDWLVRSAPFHYLVATDSVVEAGELAAHYAAVEKRCRERLEGDPRLDYLGERPDALVRPLERGEIAAHFDPSAFAAGFATVELALDTDRLCGALRRALSVSPRVRFLPGHRALAIERVGEVFRVDGDGARGPWRMQARQVVNATWERRAALDLTLGIDPPPDLLHRLKYRVIVSLPAALRGAPSVSMVLGRYGDVVVRADGTAYLSWYPAGLRGWSHGPAPPESWDPPCRGEVTDGSAREIAGALMGGIEPWFPGVSRSDPLRVDAGVIVALGRSDVDDAGSELHDRSHIGVTSLDGYHSVDPGKLTTAPWFAIEAAGRIEARCRGKDAAS